MLAQNIKPELNQKKTKIQFNYRGLLPISILGAPFVPTDFNQAPIEHKRTSLTLQLLKGIPFREAGSKRIHMAGYDLLADKMMGLSPKQMPKTNPTPSTGTY